MPGFDFKLFNNTPVEELARAVEREDVQLINEILDDTSINVNYQEAKFGHTLLMLAVANNKIKSIEALLENGADPNLKSIKQNDNSVIISANNIYSENCDTTVLSLLMKYGGNINYKQEYIESTLNGRRKIVATVLTTAITTGKCENVIKFLVNKGADINASTDYDGYGAISDAIILDNLEIARFLIIEKQARIPNYGYIRDKGGKDEQILTISDLLNEKNYQRGSKNDKLRKEIINYLKRKGVE